MLGHTSAATKASELYNAHPAWARITGTRWKPDQIWLSWRGVKPIEE